MVVKKDGEEWKGRVDVEGVEWYKWWIMVMNS